MEISLGSARAIVDNSAGIQLNVITGDRETSRELFLLAAKGYLVEERAHPH